MIKCNLKSLRTAAGLTQQQLANAAGCRRETIGLIEAGKYNPTLDLAFRICSVLHVSIDSVFRYQIE